MTTKHNWQRRGQWSNAGFTLIEVVIVIVILGIISAVAVRQMSSSVDTAKHEHTERELTQLAQAIVGNPEAYAQGSRTDFGYVGDVGALPPNLDALVQNPGGYTTWSGPYVTRGLSDNDFKLDGWNVAYTYVDTLLRSTGSGSNIDKVFASGTSALLNNAVEGYLVDANHSHPGMIYRDSVTLQLRYPDGAGGMSVAVTIPDASGSFSFTGVPMGRHVLTAIYLPDADTLTYAVSVTPGATAWIEVIFPADLWF